MQKILFTAGIWAQGFNAILCLLMAIFDHTGGLVFWALIVGCLTACLTAFYLYAKKHALTA
jgi:hypothetical protein